GVARESSATVTESSVQTSATSFTPRVAPLLESGGEPPRATLIDGASAIEAAAHVREDEPSSETPSGDRSAWKWKAASAGLTLAIGIVAVFAVSYYSKAEQAADRAFEAQQRALQIASAASERIEAARQDAATQISQARDAASKAQLTTDVLAASDLVRFNLSGGDGAVRMLAQLLWSRSRGMVFTASRMPPPRSGTIYQLSLFPAPHP